MIPRAVSWPALTAAVTTGRSGQRPVPKEPSRIARSSTWMRLNGALATRCSLRFNRVGVVQISCFGRGMDRVEGHSQSGLRGHTLRGVTCPPP